MSYHSGEVATRWQAFRHDYGKRVFSATSFRGKRHRILREITQGIVIDAGCGPLGLLLPEIGARQGTIAVGMDISLEMIGASQQATCGAHVYYTAADHRNMPFSSGSVDTIVSINAFLPETRAEVRAMFEEASRSLRRGGRLVALLPAFEMSLIARDQWGMSIRLDVAERREWDTGDWQCFYTLNDIEDLMARHGFRQWRVEQMKFSEPDEVAHIHEVYASNLKGVARDRVIEYPLFEHLLVATR